MFLWLQAILVYTILMLHLFCMKKKRKEMTPSMRTLVGDDAGKGEAAVDQIKDPNK
ncbi:unnamed protein product [Cylicocyclus nassatus]|uniref:Uncharacterized protein n=1 Tax=Cylicocyclus nassatus TaxID=53992 RepID=A0AA36MFD9_CYLNA|nr:unnamed protein product [Cylicocyclus nassatus]